MTIFKHVIALHFSLMPVDPPGVMLCLRVTARISAILLASSFASLALSRLWPYPLIQWMASNRHRFALLFALSHTLHLAGVVTLVTLVPDQFLSKKGLPVLIVGGTAYALIYYMAWTAFTRRKSPELPDGKMQTVGLYVLWAVFTLAFTTGVVRNAWVYAPLASIMWFAFAARVAARLAGNTMERVSLADP